MKKEQLICSILVGVSIILAVVGFFILPETVTVQVGMDGKPSNTMPKLFAMMIPVALTVLGFVMSRINEDKKSVIISVVGVVVGVATILMNFR